MVWYGMVCPAVSGRRIACPSRSPLRARGRGSSRHRHRAGWCTQGGGGLAALSPTPCPPIPLPLVLPSLAPLTASTAAVLAWRRVQDGACCRPLCGARPPHWLHPQVWPATKCWRVPPGIGHHPQVVHDILLWGARSGLSVTRAMWRLQDPSLVALPLALAPHGSWRVPPGIGHDPQAWEGSARHRAPPTSCREGRNTCVVHRGGQLPCPLETACVLGPFAGRHACGRVPPGIGHHPPAVHDILPWGAHSGLSVTRAGCRLLDPSLVASPLALAPHKSRRVPPGIGHDPQAWEGSARHRAPPTSMGGFRPA